VPANRRGSNEETVITEIGQAGTQLDGFAHQTHENSLYHCFAVDEAATRGGFTRLGIEKFGALVTRGVALPGGLRYTDGNAEERMEPVRRSIHFVPLGKVPVVDDVVPLAKAFAEISGAGTGGFILRHRAEPRLYVLAGELARHVESSFGEQAWSRVGAMPVAQVVEQAYNTPAVVPVAPQPVDAEADVAPYRARPATVFVVVEFGQQVGWLFNHEPLAGSVSTPPPRFRCSRGHDNPDPDNGTCYRCPAPVRAVP
jgi:hypothetical protein